MLSRAYSLTGSWEELRDIETSFDYNDLDLPSGVYYPLCFGCGIPTSLNKQLHPTYLRGRLQTVPGFVDTAVPLCGKASVPSARRRWA